jgi:hypothetical protein
MGKRRRDALGKRRLEGAPTDKNGIRDRRKVKGVATMLTAGRRCSRRRLGVGGGAASVFTAASAPVRFPPLSRAAPPSSGSSRTRPASAATSRRWRGAPSFSTPPPLLLLPSFLFPLRRRGTGKGQNPNVGWWRWPSSPLPSPLLLNPGAARNRAKSRCCPGLGCPGARGGAPPLSARPWSPRVGRGVKVAFPSPVPARFARGRARPLGVRAG